VSLLPARQHVPAGALPRHRHAEGYVALVLRGAYEEAGDNGRRAVAAGDVVVHRPWQAHLNRVPARGAEVLNLSAAPGLGPFGHVADPDDIVRLHERDPRAAAEALVEQFRPATVAADWPDALAAGLADARLDLRTWAEQLEISPEHLSRRFARLYGVAPQRFRWEARARAAWADVVTSAAPLAEIALLRGFSDQAHMTRAVSALTGRPPGAWRRSIPFKTAA
jgi:AraC-like DNA-binding protein